MTGPEPAAPNGATAGAWPVTALPSATRAGVDHLLAVRLTARWAVIWNAAPSRGPAGAGWQYEET